MYVDRVETSKAEPSHAEVLEDIRALLSEALDGVPTEPEDAEGQPCGLIAVTGLTTPAAGT